MKIFMTPNDKQTETNNGIGQVILAQYKYLPEYGIEFTDNFDEADLAVAHIHGMNLPHVEITHVHGCYWTGDEPGYEQWHGHVNHSILESVKRSLAVTVPSDWVSMAFKRDMRLSPEVIGHGITLADWQPLPVEERRDYLLWNKNRADIVSSPQPATELARRGIPVISTFGDPNVMQVTGPVPHSQMKSYLQHAGVYLSTSKETFGIGILEALASGVPVLGYAHGGILDLVRHKKTGYLVEPGDASGLEAGYKWLMENREEMQADIAAEVSGRDWKNIIGRYASLYREVFELKQRQRKVSVVVTNYNYERYVSGAIESALGQTFQGEMEVIVVDDGSTDNSLARIENYSGFKNVSILRQTNQGVAAARNAGINASNGDYVTCLDADDYLEPTYLEVTFKALEADRALGIAYTGLNLVFEDGSVSASAWPPEFAFELLAKPGIPPPNCIPCAAMFRKAMWERAGGYRQEYAPGEDTEFWLRGLSVGFNAKKVTSEPLFNYRIHPGSASQTKAYTDITGDKPWIVDTSLMPMAAPTKGPNLVRSYSEPLVSVIIPVGPGHAKYLNKALDSLVAQSFKQWEVLVIDDAPEGVDSKILEPYPFVRLLETHPYYDTTNSFGAGVARNVGIEYSEAPLLFFLDADDYLVPDALEKMVRAYTESDRTYVFSDWYAASPGKPLEHQNCQEYNQEAVREKIQHAVSVLVETEAVIKVGGFDEELPSWEDWDFFLKLASLGFCGARVPEPLLVYRTDTGTRRQKSFEPGSTLYQQIVDKWKGVEFMACCGGDSQTAAQANRVMSYPPSQEPAPDGTVKLQYIGGSLGWATYLGRYQAGNDGVHNFIFALPEHVDTLLQSGKFASV